MKKGGNLYSQWKTWMGITSIFIGILVLWAVFGWMIWKTFCSMEERGQFGDLFGAVNALFSGFAFAGVLITIWLQNKELKSSNDQFKLQNQTIKRQRFESTFFSLLELHQHNKKTMAIDTNHAGEIVFINFLVRFRRNLESAGLLVLSGTPPTAWNTTYSELYNDFAPMLSSYLQSLIAVNELICRYSTKFQTRKRYQTILDAFISVKEREFLFYHCILSDRNPVNDKIRKINRTLGIYRSIGVNNYLDQSHKLLTSNELSHIWD